MAISRSLAADSLTIQIYQATLRQICRNVVLEIMETSKTISKCIWLWIRAPAPATTLTPQWRATRIIFPNSPWAQWRALVASLIYQTLRAGFKISSFKLSQGKVKTAVLSEWLVAVSSLTKVLATVMAPRVKTLRDLVAHRSMDRTISIIHSTDKQQTVSWTKQVWCTTPCMEVVAVVSKFSNQLARWGSCQAKEALALSVQLQIATKSTKTIQSTSRLKTRQV